MEPLQTERTQSNIRINESINNADDEEDQGCWKNFVDRCTYRFMYRFMFTVNGVAIAIAIVLVILCYKHANENPLFVWHPALLAVGWLLCMTLSITAFSDYTLFARYLSQPARVRLHWILQTVACTLSFVGFIPALVHKILKNKSQFKTYHAQFGLASYLFAIIAIVSGVYALWRNSTLNKFCHAFLGYVTFLLGSVTLCCSFYSHWFLVSKGESPESYLFVIIYLTIGVSIKVLITLVERSIFLSRTNWVG